MTNAEELIALISEKDIVVGILVFFFANFIVALCNWIFSGRSYRRAQILLEIVSAVEQGKKNDSNLEQTKQDLLNVSYEELKQFVMFSLQWRNEVARVSRQLPITLICCVSFLVVLLGDLLNGRIGEMEDIPIDALVWLVLICMLLDCLIGVVIKKITKLIMWVCFVLFGTLLNLKSEFYRIWIDSICGVCRDCRDNRVGWRKWLGLTFDHLIRFKGDKSNSDNLAYQALIKRELSVLRSRKINLRKRIEGVETDLGQFYPHSYLCSLMSYREQLILGEDALRGLLACADQKMDKAIG